MRPCTGNPASPEQARDRRSDRRPASASMVLAWLKLTSSASPVALRLPARTAAAQSVALRTNTSLSGQLGTRRPQTIELRRDHGAAARLVVHALDEARLGDESVVGDTGTANGCAPAATSPRGRRGTHWRETTPGRQRARRCAGPRRVPNAPARTGLHAHSRTDRKGGARRTARSNAPSRIEPFFVARRADCVGDRGSTGTLCSSKQA